MTCRMSIIMAIAAAAAAAIRRFPWHKACNFRQIPCTSPDTIEKDA